MSWPLRVECEVEFRSGIKTGIVSWMCFMMVEFEIGSSIVAWINSEIWSWILLSSVSRVEVELAGSAMKSGTWSGMGSRIWFIILEFETGSLMGLGIKSGVRSGILFRVSRIEVEFLGSVMKSGMWRGIASWMLSLMLEFDIGSLIGTGIKSRIWSEISMDDSAGFSEVYWRHQLIGVRQFGALFGENCQQTLAVWPEMEFDGSFKENCQHSHP